MTLEPVQFIFRLAKRELSSVDDNCVINLIVCCQETSLNDNHGRLEFLAVSCNVMWVWSCLMENIRDVGIEPNKARCLNFRKNVRLATGGVQCEGERVPDCGRYGADKVLK